MVGLIANDSRLGDFEVLVRSELGKQYNIIIMNPTARFKSVLIMSTVFLVFFGRQPFAKSSSPPPGGIPHSVLWGVYDERYRKADQLVRDRRNEKLVRKGFEAYHELYKSFPKDPVTAWKFSMACYFIGIRLSKTEDERLLHYEMGEKAGYEGAKLSPACAPCHFWGAINLALYADTKGLFQSLSSIAEIESHLKRAVELDGGYNNAAAHRLLALINRKLPGILGGDNGDAKRHMESALKLAPTEPMNYLELAILLNDEYEEPVKALEVALKGIKVPQPGEAEIESQDALKELKALVKKLKQEVASVSF